VVVASSDGAALHQSWEERIKSLSECISIAVQSGFPVYCTRIEEVLCVFVTVVLENFVWQQLFEHLNQCPYLLLCWIVIFASNNVIL